MQNYSFKLKIFQKLFLTCFLVVSCWLSVVSFVFAGAPSGVDWFQILTDKQTGSDNTGDGGTGLAADYNYYYVGQSFTGTIQIKAGTGTGDGSNASNIWVDYATATTTASNLTTGSFFATWTGQSISGGRIQSTGYRTSSYSYGTGTFGTADFLMIYPTEANYGTTKAGTLDINIGTVGATTESNIARDGVDNLDDAEDFRFHVWADTKKPYALNASPSTGATGVSIDTNYTFDLRDSKNGEGDNTGVGTGVNTATPPGTLTFNSTSYTAYDSYSCSGIWGTNLCSATVNPSSPLSISGDTRNWAYNTLYTVEIGGFRDYASASQDQLGDANGPNTMDTKTWTFTTEADVVAPQVVTETPTRASSNNATTTNLVIDITDRKTYPSGPSGSGVNASTCRINVSSPTFTLVTFQQGDATVTVSDIDYGKRFTINPATNFGENETVTVSVYDCADTASTPNAMVTDNYTFTTTDGSAPYVDTKSPDNDVTISTTGTISFHVKDAGTGVSLANTYVYVNGTYYSNSGGAISITTTDTKITATTSLNFNGGNYIGDTTDVTGTSADYTFIIDPETNFTADEAVPIIIYSKDTSSNLMEQVVYALPVQGTSCAAGSLYCGTNTTWDGALCNANACASGSTYCGSNTSWNGSACVGTGGGSGSTAGGGGPAHLTSSKITNASVAQVDENSVVVSWSMGVPGAGWVAYDTKSSDGSSSQPTYGYRYKTETTKDAREFHTIVVKGLKPGNLYYFRPAAFVNNDTYVLGPELVMTPRFAQVIIKEVISQEQGKVICKNDITKEKIIYRDRETIKEKTCAPTEKACPAVEPPQCPTTPPETTKENKTTSTPIEPQTQKDEPVVYVIPKKVIILSWPLYLAIGLSIAALGLIVNALRLRRKISDGLGAISRLPEIMDVGASKTSSRRAWTAAAMIATALAIITIFWALLGPTGFWNKLRENFVKSTSSPITVSGSIVDPINYQGIAGVDLSVNETSIHTSAGGYYIFSNANENGAIQINHPMLNRTILKTIDDSRMKIYFDAKMYNALIDIVNMESRGKYSDVYRNLADEAKKKTNFENFAASYKSIFSQNDIAAQTITIGKVEILDNWNDPSRKYDTNLAKVAKISVLNGDKSSDYYLTLSGGVWKLVK